VSLSFPQPNENSAFVEEEKFHGDKFSEFTAQMSPPAMLFLARYAASALPTFDCNCLRSYLSDYFTTRISIKLELITFNSQRELQSEMKRARIALKIILSHCEVRNGFGGAVCGNLSSSPRPRPSSPFNSRNVFSLSVKSTSSRHWP
jgi:hypothetical protein